MFITIVNPFDAYGGSQRIARGLFDTLGAVGHDVSIRLGFGGGGFLSDLSASKIDFDIANVKVRKILYPLWSLLISIPVAAAVLRGRVVWANTVYASLPVLLASLLRPRLVVVHLHETTFPALFMPLLRLMALRGVRMICVSVEHANRIRLPAKVLYNYVELPDFEEHSACNRLLFVGTTQSFKGFALFVNVCAQLGDLPLRCVAYLSDKERYNFALVDNARRVGIEIIFGQSDCEKIYQDGFLLLQLTDPALCLETFSLVAVEAAVRGIPVAGAGTTVLHEVLSDALAFDVPSRDPAAIAEKIRLLYTDCSRHAALRDACFQLRTQYSQLAFIENIKAILREFDRHVK